MRPAFLALLPALILAVACAGSSEVVPTASPTTTATTSLPGDAIIICPVIGNGATPATPTPQPSCAPGDIEPRVEIADGVVASHGTPPSLPDGAIQLSNYFEFDALEAIPGLVLSVPLRVDTGDQSVYKTVPEGGEAYWFTYTDQGWTRLNRPMIEDNGDTLVAKSSFTPLPANLIVLAEPAP